MTRDEALQRAAQCWCEERTSHTVMDVHLAEVVADAILAADKAAYQRGIEDAIKAVPKSQGLDEVFYEQGYNNCRSETLWKLGELK